MADLNKLNWEPAEGEEYYGVLGMTLMGLRVPKPIARFICRRVPFCARLARMYVWRGTSFSDAKDNLAKFAKNSRVWRVSMHRCGPGLEDGGTMLLADADHEGNIYPVHIPTA